MNKLLRPMCVACVCVVFTGCGGRRGYDGAQRFPLSGKVTFDGEPVDYGAISFLPLEGDKQRVSGGTIGDGAYSVPEAQGANAGQYRVEIHWMKKTGKQLYDAELSMMVDVRKEALPPRFHKDSELTAEVSEDQTTFDFDLKSE